MNYHCDVLEAKIVLGESLVVSIGSEFIENNGEDAERQKDLSEEKRKGSDACQEGNENFIHKKASGC